LLHICAASDTGCEIRHHKIPVAEETAAVAEEFYMEPVIAALHGGGDYELLFTIPVADYEKVMTHEDISVIGYMTGKEKGCCLVTENGTRIELERMKNFT
jgi:thiamine-monophosphate kinase